MLWVKTCQNPLKFQRVAKVYKVGHTIVEGRGLNFSGV